MDLDEIGKAAVTVADKLIKNENVEKNIIIEGRYCTTDTIKESQEHIWELNKYISCRRRLCYSLII